MDKEDEDMTILIEGTAHCADMNPDGVADRPALKQARKVRHTAGQTTLR